MKHALILIVILITGCSSQEWKPYSEIGLGYKVLGTDELRKTGRNPTAHIEAGYVSKSGWQVGLSHDSHLLDGSPFNNNKEWDVNNIIIQKRFGGKF